MGENNNNYSIWIKIISVVIPLVVAGLFTVKIEYELPIFLPPIYSTINGITAILLIIAFWAIKNRKIKLHENLMKICIALSLVFLIMYIAYHITSTSTIFGDVNNDGIRDASEKAEIGRELYIYAFILISHIVLSIALIPMVLTSYVRAIQKEFDPHKKIGKITLPVWLYVTITGVIVYIMISPYY